MLRSLTFMLFALVLVTLAPVASAGTTGSTEDDLFVRKTSPHAVAVTIDRLAKAVEAAGAKVFARIDHAAGAASIDVAMRPSTVLLFGNPRLGTPLMQSAPQIAIDLPLRALAYEDEAGQVWLAYLKPSVLKDRYGIADRDAVFERMGGALDRLTNAAVAAAE